MPLIGSDYVPGAGQGSRSDFENYLFATDWFDAAHPMQQLGRPVCADLQGAYGQPPETYAANAYEDIFAIWAFVRHLTAKGGTLKSWAGSAKRTSRQPWTQRASTVARARAR